MFSRLKFSIIYLTVYGPIMLLVCATAEYLYGINKYDVFFYTYNLQYII